MRSQIVRSNPEEVLSTDGAAKPEPTFVSIIEKLKE
jgi:hypothetical protein